MISLFSIRPAAAVSVLALAACTSSPFAHRSALIDRASGLDSFDRVGNANWQAANGSIQASAGDKTQAFLVTRDSYKNFTAHVEFWASDDANSGVFFRCQDPSRITDENCYEANIFDQRPDLSYGTGAITKVAKVAMPYPKVGGQWNTYEITAKGNRLTLVLNGRKTVDVENDKFASGPIALQWARGTIKFRKVEVNPLR